MYFLRYEQNNPKYLNDFLMYDRYITRNAETTVNETYSDLKLFFNYLKLRNNNCKDITREKIKEAEIIDISIADLRKVNSFIINDFLFFLRNALDNTPETRNRKLASLKSFFGYLYNNNYIPINPAQNIKSAQVKKRVPKYLNLDDSKKLLSSTINSNQRNNIRNYAIICLFLNCCLRLSELVELNITDIKLDEKTIRVRGKGDKERILYLNEATTEAIEEYLKVRTTLSKTDYNYNALFLSEQKKRISKRSVQNIVKEAITKAVEELSSELHTHSLRHTGATLMYNECDVNILIIQKILGHTHLSSTEIYTHVSNKNLQEIMQNYGISSILEKMEG